MPQDVWWGCTTALIVFILAPFAVYFFTFLSLLIFPPVGVLMGWIGLPHFMPAYGLTAVQLVLQAALFGWLARRRTIEQRLLLAMVGLIALASAMTIIGSRLGIESLIIHTE